MASRSRLFSKIAKDVDVTGNLTAAAISSDVSFGVTVYDSTGVLPYIGNSTGDQAYVKDNNRFYIWDSSGWYNVALINRAPTISSVQDSDGNTTPFTLSSEGAVTTITITATDSDGDLITYSASPDAGFNGLGTVTSEGSVFTITPFSADSASTESGTITFKATDGVNIASSGVQTFTLSFTSEYWKDVALSVGTSSTNSLANSTFIDRSTNAHTVAPTGSPTQTAFHPYLDNWSNYFYTNASYLSLTGGAVGSGDFTVEAWINVDNHHNYSLVYDTRATGTSSTGYAFGIEAAGSVYFYTGGAFRIVTDTSLDVNTWHHVALVRSGSTISIWIDGIQDSNTYTSSATFSDTNAGIGQARTYTTTGQFQGYISNFRVVAGTAVYTSTFTPPTENLTAVTNTILLACQNNRFVDNSSNEYALTVVGSPKVSAFNPFGQESEYAVGENKGSIELDGSGDYLSITDDGSFDFGTGDFTIETWIYATSSLTSSNLTIIDARPASGSTTGNYYFLISSTGKLRLIHALGATDTTYESTSTLSPNQWYHVVASRSGDTLRLFIDGVVENTTSVSGKSFNATLFNIGYKSYTTSSLTYWPGYFSDLRIIKGTATYTSAFTPPTAPVGNTNSSLYLPMDNAGIFDKTGSAYITGDAVTSTTQNKFADTSIYFDGSEKLYVEDHNVDFAASTPFTVEFWLYGNGGGGLISWTGVRDQLDTTLLIAFDDSLAFYSGSYITPTGQSSLTGSQWNHIAMVRGTDNYIRLYLNGTLYSTSSSTFTSRIKKPIELGGYATTRFTGYMENLQMLPGVAKYTSNFSVPTAEQGRTYQAED